ncbi:unnamed protein product [Phaedon cochleariae]|uniref:Tetraspanin n=1 Tax=Phaedon cochleariae TaxID=80249 RepID=A0A9P0GV45_PHACE|nr:unnamed protein product [Phaedon cochleariae]
MRKSSSLDSWSPRRKKNKPLVIPQSQCGRNVNETCWLMCFISVITLASGLILIGLSIWSIIKKLPYVQLVKIRVDIPYFTLPAGILCIPGSWIAASIHNNKNRFQFLPLMWILTIIITALLVTGSIMGIMYEKGPNRELSSSLGNHDLNSSVYPSFLSYNSSWYAKNSWDSTQRRFECCGVYNQSDWSKNGLKIPCSCCGNNGTCDVSNSFPEGCLDSLSRELTWDKNIMKSHCYMMSVIQIGLGIMMIAVHICTILKRR